VDKVDFTGAEFGLRRKVISRAHKVWGMETGDLKTVYQSIEFCPLHSDLCHLSSVI